MNLEGKIGGYQKKTLVAAAIAIVVAGAVFYAGAKYEKAKLAKLPKSNTCAISDTTKVSKKQAAADAAAKAANSISGTITAKDARNITLKLADGTSKVIALDEATLTVGEAVTVVGQTNADGSFTTQSIGKTVVSAPTDTTATKKAKTPKTTTATDTVQ